jgi:hypothetical protein
MSIAIDRHWKLASFGLGCILSIVPNSAIAQAGRNDGLLSNTVKQNFEQEIEQVTSVSELRDVEPTAWAFEALRSLVERYGCIVGYPDRTFRGDRALTRWEFAAGLNACMNTMERLLQENVAVLQEDLDKLKRLVEEFQAELAMLGARIDNLEQRVAFLEDHSFSTTTKLKGEVVIGLQGIAAGEKDGGESISKNPTLGYRARLQFNTSFTGEDLLYTRLATGNISGLDEVTGTFQSTLGYIQPDDSQLAVEVLHYRFPLAKDINVWLEAAGGVFDDFTNTNNALDGDDGAAGAISAFGTRNPLYYMSEGAGVGIQGNWSGLEWTLGYLAPDGSDPSQGAGLFNGAYGAIAQLGYNPSDNFGIAFTYINGYNNLDTGTGSVRSNFQFFVEDEFGQEVRTSNNSYGLGFSWKLFDGFVLGGWGGLTKSRTLNAFTTQEFIIDDDVFTQETGRGSLDIWNWAVTVAFPDFLKEGSTAGIIFGMQPWVAKSSLSLPDDVRLTDNQSSFHIEAFYQYALTDNIAITPGILVITSPDYDRRNAALVIGTLRTTFTF